MSEMSNLKIPHPMYLNLDFKSFCFKLNLEIIFFFQYCYCYDFNLLALFLRLWISETSAYLHISIQLFIFYHIFDLCIYVKFYDIICDSNRNNVSFFIKRNSWHNYVDDQLVQKQLNREIGPEFSYNLQFFEWKIMFTLKWNIKLELISKNEIYRNWI